MPVINLHKTHVCMCMCVCVYVCVCVCGGMGEVGGGGGELFNINVKGHYSVNY